MIAAFIEGYGTDRELKIGEVPDPHPGPMDVLIRIRAASVNPIDFKIRDGKLRFLRPYVFPLIMGHDCAGEVVAVGERVQRFKVGDRVFSRPRNGRTGTFAEFIAVDQNEVALMPANVGFEEAAGLPLVGLTSWQAMLDVGQLKRGQKVLIHAGSGGVGTFAIQLAKHVGAEVWTTTSERNIEFVESLGADHVVNYRTERFEDRVPEMDLIFDTLGGDALERSFQVVKRGGWVVSVSGVPDYRLGRDMGLPLWKSLILGIVGSGANLKARKRGARYRFIFMKSNGEQLERIADLVNKGFIKPVVDKVFPLSEASAALRYSESGRARGKIIIRP